MRYAVIASKKDPAGMNIAEQLKKHGTEAGMFEGNPVYLLNIEGGNEAKLYTVNKEAIDNEDIDKEIDCDMILFATKHQSKSGIPSLSVHSPGNWSKAEFGGRDRELNVAPALLLKELFSELEKNGSGTDFEVVMEATHHGPFVEKPIAFIEIGSTEKEWKREDAGAIIAKTIMNVLQRDLKSHRTAMGIGGMHTCPNFRKIQLGGKIALGHICPKYMLEELDREMMQQALNRTIPLADMVILDWKGLKDQKGRIKSLLDELDVEVKRTKEF